MMMEEKGEKKDGLNTSEETISAVESSEEDEEDGSDKIQGNNGDKDKDNKDPLDIGDKKDIIKETSVEEIDSGRALPDYQQALKELAQIADNNRIILDEDDWKDQGQEWEGMYQMVRGQGFFSPAVEQVGLKGQEGILFFVRSTKFLALYANNGTDYSLEK